MKLWETDLNTYARRYFHGEKGRTNRGQALGKEVAESLETGVETGKPDLDIVIAQLPKYKLRDRVTHCDLSVGKGRDRHFVPILMKIDSLDPSYLMFKEYKTGAGPWTQKMVDEDDQISFYTAGLYLKVKSLGGVEIPTSELIWAPTEKHVDPDGMERPYLTGEIKRFPTSRTYTEVLQMHARMSKAWREIGEAMAEELL